MLEKYDLSSALMESTFHFFSGQVSHTGIRRFCYLYDQPKPPDGNLEKALLFHLPAHNAFCKSAEDEGKVHCKEHKLFTSDAGMAESKYKAFIHSKRDLLYFLHFSYVQMKNGRKAPKPYLLSD